MNQKATPVSNPTAISRAKFPWMIAGPLMCLGLVGILDIFGLKFLALGVGIGATIQAICFFLWVRANDT